MDEVASPMSINQQRTKMFEARNLARMQTNSAQYASQHSLPRPNEDLNSDIMVLISKPAKLEPLKHLTRNTLGSSSESSLDSVGNREKRSFNYPPDLDTAK